jgi:hypothetical protein
MTHFVIKVLEGVAIFVFVVLLFVAFSVAVFHYQGWYARGWTHPKAAEEVCGVYWGEDELSYCMLSLRPDGTYSQCVAIKESLETARSVGHWRFEPSDHAVIFHDGFMIVDAWGHLDGFYHPQVNPDFARPFKGSVFKGLHYDNRGLFILLDESHECKKVD